MTLGPYQMYLNEVQHRLEGCVGAAWGGGVCLVLAGQPGVGERWGWHPAAPSSPCRAAPTSCWASASYRDGDPSALCWWPSQSVTGA